MPLTSVSAAAARNSTVNYGPVESSRTNATIQPVIQQIDPITNINVVSVMETATRSVSHPLESISTEDISKLSLPWYDRLLINTWCFKNFITVSSLHKLERSNAIKAIEKIQSLVDMFEKDIQKMEDELDAIGTDLNTYLHNAQNAGTISNANARLYKRRAEELSIKQVQKEVDIEAKRKMIFKAQALIRKLEPKSREIDNVIFDYSASIGLGGMDRVIAEAEKRSDMVNEALKFNEERADFAATVEGEGEDYVREEAKRRMQVLMSVAPTLEVRVKHPVVNKRKGDPPPPPPDDDDDAEGQLEKDLLLPPTSTPKIVAEARTQELNRAMSATAESKSREIGPLLV